MMGKHSFEMSRNTSYGNKPDSDDQPKRNVLNHSHTDTKRRKFNSPPPSESRSVRTRNTHHGPFAPKTQSHESQAPLPILSQSQSPFQSNPAVDRSPMEDDTAVIFPKLDISDPVQARRLQQRRRVVAYGKNTVGYDEYRRQIPIPQRKTRCMDHPSTPDHTLDIPNRRWLGLVKAWRIALHKFDPPEMKGQQNNGSPSMNDTDLDMTLSQGDHVVVSTSNKTTCTVVTVEKKSVQEEEMERATRQGLLVDFVSQEEDEEGKARKKREEEEDLILTSTESLRRILFRHSEDDNDMVDLNTVNESVEEKKDEDDHVEEDECDEDELDRWEKKRNMKDKDCDFLVDYDDSDDDLL